MLLYKKHTYKPIEFDIAKAIIEGYPHLYGSNYLPFVNTDDGSNNIPIEESDYKMDFESHPKCNYSLRHKDKHKLPNFCYI